MITLNPNQPNQTIMEFGSGDILCGRGIGTFPNVKKRNVFCCYYNADRKIKISSSIEETRSVAELPLPNVVMTFTQIESLNVVIELLQNLKKEMENQNEENKSSKSKCN